MKLRIGALILAVGFIAVGFQNCGEQGFEAVSGGTTVLSSGPPADPVMSKIEAPSHVPVGECVEVKIEALSQPSAPQPLVFEDYLKPLLFINADCEGATIATTPLTNEDLPKSLYFRSQHLFQQEISVKIGGQDSNKVLLTAYKRHFADASKSSPASVFMQSNYNLRARSFSFYTSTYSPETTSITNILFGPVNANDTTDRAAGDEALSTANFATTPALFTKTQVLIAGLTIPAVANEIIAPVQQPANQMSCYSSMNEVFCQNNLASSPPAVFQKIALPMSLGTDQLQDLSSAVVSVACAVKNGRVFCWKNDFVVQEITGLGDNNIAVAVTLMRGTATISQMLASGQICSLANERVRCLDRGTLVTLDSTGVRRIWSGPAPSTVLIQGFDADRTPYVLGEYLNGPVDLKYYLTITEKFDELHPLILANRAVQFPNLGGILIACGRAGIKLICYEGASGMGAGRGPLAGVESTETFDIR